MGIFDRLSTAEAKEGLAALSGKFRGLPFRTKVITGAVGLGLVLVAYYLYWRKNQESLPGG